MEAIKVWPTEYAHPDAFDALPETARLLIVALLHPEPAQRLGRAHSSESLVLLDFPDELLGLSERFVEFHLQLGS